MNYEQLMEEWHEDVKYHSSYHQICKHENHKKLLDVGKDLLPYLFECLEADKYIHQCFILLPQLTGWSPEHKSLGVGTWVAIDVPQTRLNWLEWGRQHGYIQ